MNDHSAGDLGDGDADRHTAQAQPPWKNCDKNIAVNGVEKHLEDGVESHKRRSILGVAMGQAVPDDDHCDTSRKPYQDKADHILMISPEESNGQQKHKYGAD